MTEDASVRLTLSARLTDVDDDERLVTAVRQSRLLDTLDHVLDAIQTAAAAAVEHRLVGGVVTGVHELARTWQAVACRDGEVRNDQDLSACCEFSSVWTSGSAPRDNCCKPTVPCRIRLIRTLT